MDICYVDTYGKIALAGRTTAQTEQSFFSRGRFRTLVGPVLFIHCNVVHGHETTKAFSLLQDTMVAFT